MDKWPFGDLKPHEHDLVVADPPWPWAVRTPRGTAKSPQAQYSLMTEQEIQALPVVELAAYPCLLLCWATFPLIDKQIAIVKRWGFAFKTVMVWHKVFESGKTAMGTGYRVRTMAEPVIVATLGSPAHTAFPGLFKGIRRQHSRKPESFYEMLDQCCPDLTRRADLFARQSRPGWTTWGAEAAKFDVEEVA